LIRAGAAASSVTDPIFYVIADWLTVPLLNPKAGIRRAHGARPSAIAP